MRLNKFEKTRLISARADELANGAKPKVEVAEGKNLVTKDYSRIAEEELDAGLLELEIYKE